MEREWKLGNDLTEQDDILDPITFEELITTVHCNCKVISEKNVKKTLDDIVQMRMEDMKDLLRLNMTEIMIRAYGDKPLNMSFKDGTLDRMVAENRIKGAGKKIVFKEPDADNRKIELEEAIRIIRETAEIWIREENGMIWIGLEK